MIVDKSLGAPGEGKWIDHCEHPMFGINEGGNIPLVYKLFLKKSIQYVGLTTDGLRRAVAHAHPDNGKPVKIFDNIHFWICKNEVDMALCEKFLTIQYKPPLNKSNKYASMTEELMSVFKNEMMYLREHGTDGNLINNPLNELCNGNNI